MFHRFQGFFVSLYILLCGGSLFKKGGTLGPNGLPQQVGPQHSWRQLPALVALTVPFFLVALGIEIVIDTFLTMKYYRIFLTVYIVAVFFFVASVDRRAQAEAEAEELR